ncbi:hypothetical protein MD484_g2084, partial [Candolleomyces efflorescens]
MASFQLSDGTSIPWVAWGNGTGQAKKDPIEAGKLALESGLRHIDTAQLYDNEKETGIAVEQAAVPRKEVYVTSKISGWQGEEENPVPLNEIRGSVQESLDRLGFVPDLYLIHNPFVVPPGQLKEFWKVLEELKDEGKLESIGVSNFRPQDFEAVLDGAKYKPVVNQLEYHPYTLAHLEPVLEIQAKHGILTTSYGPLTPLLRHPTGGPLKPILNRIASRLTKKYGEDIDAAAVLLLWLKAKQVVASNWELDPQEVEEITTIGKTIHFRFYTTHMEKDFPLPDLPRE